MGPWPRPCARLAPIVATIPAARLELLRECRRAYPEAEIRHDYGYPGCDQRTEHVRTHRQTHRRIQRSAERSSLSITCSAAAVFLGAVLTTTSIEPRR